MNGNIILNNTFFIKISDEFESMHKKSVLSMDNGFASSKQSSARKINAYNRHMHHYSPRIINPIDVSRSADAWGFIYFVTCAPFY